MQREKTPEWREKQKSSRGIRRGQRYRLVFQFPILLLPGVWHGSLAGRSRPALLMLPRFADIFQQGNRWLNWLEKQPEGAVRPVVIESVTKIM
ncbi:hypothetical protein, partial [Shigella flexneri]|uniref:hypothetical protein n=1 Tax=Shigella flexneri TaxID=623 RepID=UPI003F5404E8